MKLEIPMAFSKTTKRKIVFATDDALAPTSNIYLLTEYLESQGIKTKWIVVTITDTPFSDDEIAKMLAMIPMRTSRETKYKTVFASVDADAPVDSLYMISEWLRSHDFGDLLYLGITDAGTGDQPAGDQDGADDAAESESLSPDAAFDAFLEEAIVKRKGNQLTTAQIRTPWAALHDAHPEDDVIGGIHKNSVARRFRAHYSAPPGKRGRVNGKIEYYWEGYAVIEED